MSTRSIEETETVRRVGILFALSLFFLLAGFLAMTPSYPPRSRLFPVLVAVPAIACMVLVLLSYRFSTVERIVGSFDAAFFESDSDVFESENEMIREGGIRRALGWTVGFLVAIYLFGFVATSFLLVYAYMTFEGEHGTRRSLLVATLTTVCMYALFGLLFGVRLEGGAVLTYLLELAGV